MGRDNKWCDNFGFLKWYKPLSLLFELGFLNMQVELTMSEKKIEYWSLKINKQTKESTPFSLNL